jgi:hypothetical protein
LWSVVSGNQTVSGGGGGRDQNQSIPDFVRGYNYLFIDTSQTNTSRDILENILYYFVCKRLGQMKSCHRLNAPRC